VLTVELERTKADNVKLYGKIRYVQDYNHEKVVSRGSKRVLDCNSISHSFFFLFLSFPDYRSLSFLRLIFFMVLSFSATRGS
jgi:hypothetical protein